MGVPNKKELMEHNAALEARIVRLEGLLTSSQQTVYDTDRYDIRYVVADGVEIGGMWYKENDQLSLHVQIVDSPDKRPCHAPFMSVALAGSPWRPFTEYAFGLIPENMDDIPTWVNLEYTKESNKTNKFYISNQLSNPDNNPNTQYQIIEKIGFSS